MIDWLLKVIVVNAGNMSRYLPIVQILEMIIRKEVMHT